MYMPKRPPMSVKSTAARMAAEEDEMQAPVVPTTNMQLPNRQQPKPQVMQAFSSPQGQGANGQIAPGPMLPGSAGPPGASSAPRIQQGPMLTSGQQQQTAPNYNGNSGIPGGAKSRTRTYLDNVAAGSPPLTGDAAYDAAENRLLNGVPINQQYNDAQQGLLASEAPTRQYYADLVNQQMRYQFNNDESRMRAAFGGSGFGRSGALLAADADLRRKAAMDAAMQTEDLYNKAQDQYRQNVSTGAGMANQRSALDISSESAGLGAVNADRRLSMDEVDSRNKHDAALAAAGLKPPPRDDNNDGKDDSSGKPMPQATDDYARETAEAGPKAISDNESAKGGGMFGDRRQGTMDDPIDVPDGTTRSDLEKKGLTFRHVGNSWGTNRYADQFGKIWAFKPEQDR